MVGVYIIIALGAVVLVALGVDNLPKELAGKSKNVKKEILELTVATFKHLRHPYMILIIPLTMYSGFEQASFNAEFSKVRVLVIFTFCSTHGQGAAPAQW